MYIFLIELKCYWLLSLILPLNSILSIEMKGKGIEEIFFSDLNGCDQEMLLSFATGNCYINWCFSPGRQFFLFHACLMPKPWLLAECAHSVIPAYILVMEKRKDLPSTDGHKPWQRLWRGQYDLVWNLALRLYMYIHVRFLRSGWNLFYIKKKIGNT